MKRKVFIVGAGASKEVGLPLGSELKLKIAQMLDMRSSFVRGNQADDNFEFKNALRYKIKNDGERQEDINSYLDGCKQIANALPLAISIDNFIDAHRDDEKIVYCGKLGIVKAILNAEKSSHLYIDSRKKINNLNFQSLSNTWYVPFFQLITENCSIDQLAARLKLVSLIVFNYDRCVEHFLYHSFMMYYGLNEKRAAALVAEMKIFHPYGSVGDLPYGGKSNAFEFGEEAEESRVTDLAKKIRTFTEGTDPGSSDIGAVRAGISSADELIFLGFAFHKLNLELLKPDASELGEKTTNCYATTIGISSSDKEVIADQLKSLFNRNIKIEMIDKECAGFFGEFWRSLAF